jgi:hypothetical protein
MCKVTVAAALALSAVAISNPARSQAYGIHIFESSYGLPGRVYWTCGGGRNRSAFPEYTEASLSC